AVPCCPVQARPRLPELPEAGCHSNRNGADNTARTPYRARNSSYRRTCDGKVGSGGQRWGC
ncbi:hypothetical protein B0H65DRAFT_419474, partial [Neurospora tetraspora]